ncbi:spinocerebellar ataxia type 10 protein domain-containing protein [Glomus cerebriforme]|uniref:Ataxin-10 homolog n=1 Tax=Glomus cerebriforme TaxID=658196 RepID=A0A397SEY2_9GLOM|nr:spinocerebellar ataxia type 10 protein domain-containing protein [Glomus cerebriforme]
MDFTIIQQLKKYSNSPLNNLDNLANSLKQIVSATQSNLTYRETLGQASQFWIIITKLWEKTSENLLKEELSVLPIILELVQLFRNIVAAVSGNQNQALEHKWNEITEKILWYSILKFNIEADNKFVPILRFGSQALSNVITGNIDTQELVWSDFINRNESNDILTALVKCEDSVVLTSVLVLVYNCIYESEFRSKTLIESRSGIRFLILLLERAEALLEDESSQNFELIYALISRLIDLGLFSQFYNILNQPSRQIPTRHQIILLKILDSKFFSSLKINEFSISLSNCIVRSFNSICSQVIHSMQQAENNSAILSTSEDQLCEMEDSCLLYTALILFLQCIGKLSQEDDSKLRECLFKEGVITSSISLLFQADKSFPRTTKATTLITQTLQRASSGFAFIKRDIVKIIGNMAYENNIVQDEVRKLGGIPLILNQCNIDDDNPYIREYAIFALRNLLIHNPENQKLVEQLAPIEISQHPVLQDAGIMTELGQDGKIKFSIDSSKNSRK